MSFTSLNKENGGPDIKIKSGLKSFKLFFDRIKINFVIKKF